MYKAIVRTMFILGPALLLSSCSSKSNPAPVVDRYRVSTFYDYEPYSWSASEYQVQKGDTLFSIAFRAGVDVQELARINKLDAHYTIYPGQQLQIKPVSNISTNSAKKQPKVLAENTNSTYGNDNSSTSEERQRSVPSKKKAEPVVVVPYQVSESNDEKLVWAWPSHGALVHTFSVHDPHKKALLFSGVLGEPIYAAATGKVVYVGSAIRGYGQLIIVNHHNNYITAYGHNDTVLVKEQDIVSVGQQIATMGNSGRKDVGLRFELRLKGSPVNPEHYLPKKR